MFAVGEPRQTYPSLASPRFRTSKQDVRVYEEGKRAWSFKHWFWIFKFNGFHKFEKLIFAIELDGQADFRNRQTLNFDKQYAFATFYSTHNLALA
jgi:hypothetical protein